MDVSLAELIAVLTREHGGWEQAVGLITAVARSRVKYLVLARSAGTRCLTKSAPFFVLSGVAGVAKPNI
jgi:hypothetical protein